VEGTALAQWKSGTLGTVANLDPAYARGLAVGPNGYLYQGGQFDVAGGGSAAKIAVWNGVQESPLGYEIGGASGAEVARIVVNQQNGAVIAAGLFHGYGSIDTGGTQHYAQWTGAAWLPPDIRIAASLQAFALTYGNDGALYLGGAFSGTAQAASVGTIVNGGRAQAYPTLRLRNTGAGTAHVYQLLNVTTGNGIYFNSLLLSGEQTVLTLTPGNRSYTSSFRGNAFADILPGSNLTTWSLLPGTNYVSFFSDSSSVEAAFFWQPVGWSIDSGTIY
jgi:hypothetical protein